MVVPLTIHFWVGLRYDNTPAKEEEKMFKVLKLDGVGPVDNRPSPDQLNPFVQFFKKNNKKKI